MSVLGGFAQMTTAEGRRVMSVNLDGAFFTLPAAARHMIERGGGSLVATASRAAVMGAARSEHYRDRRRLRDFLTGEERGA